MTNMEYPLSPLYIRELLSLKLKTVSSTSSHIYTCTPPTISLHIFRSITSFITVCFVITFLYTKPHFLLVEIDSSDDTKQFISPFIPCFLLMAPPPALYSVPLCVSGGEWEEAVGRLIGNSANWRSVQRWQIWHWAAVKWCYIELCNDISDGSQILILTNIHYTSHM